MVVRDVEATVRHYWEDLGIGPWRFYTLDPSNTPGMTLRGKPVRHAFRAAIAMVGEIELELIEPLEGDSLYAEHLATHGEGLHHIALDVEDFSRAVERLSAQDFPEVQGGETFDVAQYKYFDATRRLGCIIEIGSSVREGTAFPAPERVYPPHHGSAT